MVRADSPVLFSSVPGEYSGKCGEDRVLHPGPETDFHRRDDFIAGLRVSPLRYLRMVPKLKPVMRCFWIATPRMTTGMVITVPIAAWGP